MGPKGRSAAPVALYYGSQGLFNVIEDPNLSQVSSTTAKWGTKSLEAPAHQTSAGAIDFVLPQTLAAPLTAEAWVSIGTTYTDTYFSLSTFTLYNTGSNALVGLTAYGDSAFFSVGSLYRGGSSNNLTSQPSNVGPSIPLNTWTHVALAFHTSTSFSYWVNGTRRLTFTAQPALGSVNRLRLNPVGFGATGTYVDDVRISNIDRFGSVNNITVPSEPFVSDANTIALVNFEPI